MKTHLILRAMALQQVIAYVPCHWGDPNVELGQSYGDDICPPAYSLTASGACVIKYLDKNQTSCDSFCQIRTHFFHGREQPFVTFGYFIGPRDVNLTEEFHQIVRGDERIPDGDQPFLNPGVRTLLTSQPHLDSTDADCVVYRRI